jgi:hypothetical protein
MYPLFLEYSMQSVFRPLPSLEDVDRELALVDAVERCCGLLGAAVLADPNELGQGSLDDDGDLGRPVEVLLRRKIRRYICLDYGKRPTTCHESLAGGGQHPTVAWSEEDSSPRFSCEHTFCITSNPNRAYLHHGRRQQGHWGGAGLRLLVVQF